MESRRAVLVPVLKAIGIAENSNIKWVKNFTLVLKKS